MKFFVSRWRFGFLYFLLFFLAVLTVYFNDRAFDGWSWFVGVLALVLLFVLEFKVRSLRVVVSNDGVSIINGKSVSHVPFSKIHSVSVSQSVIQKVLRFGDVSFAGVSLVGFSEASRLGRLISTHSKIKGKV